MEVLKPAKAARPGVPGPAARDRPGLLPGRRLRRADPAVGAGHPAPRLGQPALLAAAGLARRGPGAARAAARRRGHRRDHLPAGQELDAGPVFGVVTEPVRPRDTAGDLLARLAVSGARLLVATLDGIEYGAAAARSRSRPTASAYAPKITAEDARVDWGLPALRVDRLIRGLHPGAGGLDRRSAGPGSSSARSSWPRPRPGRRGPAGPGRAAGRRAARAGRHRHRAGPAGRGAAAGQAADAGRRLGAAACTSPARDAPKLG